MKVLFCLTFYYPHWTGLTKYCQILAENLANKHHQIKVLTSHYKAKLPLREEFNSVEIIRVPAIGKLSRSMIMPTYLIELVKQMKDCDVVSIFSPMAEILPIVLIAKLFKKKVFVTHNGDLVLPRGMINQFIEIIYFISTYLAIKLSNKVIIYTEDYAKNSSLLSKLKDKWETILPPILIPTPNKLGVEKLKNKYQLNDYKIVGFSGRFVEEKGVDYLIKAIPNVLKKFPKTKFVFAGEYTIFYENFYEQLKEEINKNKKNLLFLGLISNQQELANFYSMCDLIVLPSRTDCFSLSQIESMLCETPVVVTDIPGARMGIKLTDAGKLVTANNSEKLSEGIIEVLTNKNKYFKKRSEIEKTFSLEKTILAYEKLFQNS